MKIAESKPKTKRISDNTYPPICDVDLNMFENTLAKLVREFNGLSFTYSSGRVHAVATSAKYVFYGVGATPVEAVARLICRCYVDGKQP